MKIHYIAQYGKNSIGRNLAYSPAGQNKMDYIIEVLLLYSISLNVFSTCGTIKNTLHFWQKVNFENKFNITYCGSFRFSLKHINLIDIFFRQIQLFFYLILVNNNDIVVIYHERFYIPIIKVIKLFKKFKILYEVEEIYTLAAKYSIQKVNKEIEFLKIADAYIFPNDLMADYLRIKDKASTVCYGSYIFQNINTEKFNDGKIHIVYAGTLDRIKGGAYTAIDLAKYLDESYHIHILGFGNDLELNDIYSRINSTDVKYKTLISYDGMLSGKEFNTFIQKCHIGLSTQDLNGEYNLTSFPSKILTYLSNDIIVLSTRLKVLECSMLNQHVLFYDTIEDMSEIIKSLKLTKVNVNTELLLKLKSRFESELFQIIKTKLSDVNK